VVVIAIVGLLAGVVIPSAARLLAGGDPRRTLDAVAAELALARAEALRESRTVLVRVSAADDAILIEHGNGSRSLQARWLGPPAEGAIGPAGVEVAFDPTGLASRRSLVFSDEGGEGGRLWSIPLDPVSGAVGSAEAVEREGERRR
jgi:type II secretory pathway pseudopilin PulG